MTRQAHEEQARARWDELVAVAGTTAADDARAQAGLPEVFVWSNLKVDQLFRLAIACRIRIMEVQS